MALAPATVSAHAGALEPVADLLASGLDDELRARLLSIVPEAEVARGPVRPGELDAGRPQGPLRADGRAARRAELVRRAISKQPAPSGSNAAARTCCRSSTSTSSSPCPRRSPRSPPRTRPSSTVCSSGPAPIRSARSLPTRATPAPSSASSRSSIPGARRSCTIPICTASFRVGARQRQQRLDCLPPRVLPAGPGPAPLLPEGAPRGVAGRLRGRRTALRRPAATSQRPIALRQPPPPGPGVSCARFCSWGGLTGQLASTASCRRWLPSSPDPRSMPSGTSPPASCSTRSAAERAAAAPSARSPRSTPTCGCSSRAVAGHSSAGRTASRNHSDGMCPACKGLGKRITVDVDKLLDLDRSVEQGAIRHPAYDIGDPTCCSRPINGGVVTGSVGYAVGAPPTACR